MNLFTRCWDWCCRRISYKEPRRRLVVEYSFGNGERRTVTAYDGEMLHITEDGIMIEPVKEK